MNDKNNPYAPHWYNKILNKRYNLTLKVNKFLNGCPIIKLARSKHDGLPLVGDKKSQCEDNKEFMTNKKGFFKARKDIEEGRVLFNFSFRSR
jgi:hypothetical protein